MIKKQIISGIILSIILILAGLTMHPLSGVSINMKQQPYTHTGRVGETPCVFDWWSMYHHDAAHTGYSLATAPNTNNTLWTYPGDEPWMYIASPIVVHGMLYIATSHNTILCLRASDGARIWEREVPGSGSLTFSVPTYADRRIYIASDETTLFCFNAETGENLWEFTTDRAIYYCNPTVSHEKVYLVDNAKLYCVNASDGMLLWNTPAEDDFSWVSPAILDDKVFIGSRVSSTPDHQGRFYCFNATTGEIIWVYEANEYSTEYWDTVSSPVVANGKVYLSIYNVPFYPDYSMMQPLLYHFDVETGERTSLLFTLPGCDTSISTPALAYGNIYFAEYQEEEYESRGVACVNATTGSQMWRTIIPTRSFLAGHTGPVIADEKVYIACDDGLFCLDAYIGDILWIKLAVDMGSYWSVYYEPAIAEDKVFAACQREICTFRDPDAENLPPYTPCLPHPYDHASEACITSNLSWTGGDPDNDPVTYDIYFDTNNPPAQVISNQTTTSFDPGVLAYNTTYYWQIIAWDSTNVSTPGPLWEFTTTSTFLLEGYCFNQGLDPVDPILVDVTNLDTGQCWQASVSTNYFALTLSPGVDINVSDTLRIIARDNTSTINVTTIEVTESDICAGSMQFELILDIHYRDLPLFPMYHSEDIPGKGLKSGAAVGKMFLDYLTWNASVHPDGPPSVYDQGWIFENFTRFNVPPAFLDVGLNYYEDPEYIDLYEMWLGLQWNSYEYGYNFWAHANSSNASILSLLCVMMDYPIPATPGHPEHVGAAIPAYGEYSNWMAIRGIHTDLNTWDPPEFPSFTIYGFWVNDPAIDGIGEHTYKTADEFLTTYYLPMDLPGDPFEDGMYSCVVDPPEGFDVLPDVTVITIGQQHTGYTPLQQQLSRTNRHIANQIIFDSARRCTDQILTLSERDMSTFTPENIIRVRSRVKQVDDYTLVVFTSETEKLVVRMGMHDGQFKELSVSEVASYLDGTSYGVYEGGSLFYPRI